MTIRDERNAVESRFSDLYPGDVFYIGGVYYMKIVSVPKDNFGKNAVNLQDGTPVFFKLDETVFEVEASLTITDK